MRNRNHHRIRVNGVLYEAVQPQPQVSVKGTTDNAVFTIQDTPFKVRVIDISGGDGDAYGVQLNARRNNLYIGSIFSARKAFNKANDLANSIALEGARDFRDLKRSHLDSLYDLVDEDTFNSLAPYSPYTSSWD